MANLNVGVGGVARLREIDWNVEMSRWTDDTVSVLDRGRRYGYVLENVPGSHFVVRVVHIEGLGVVDGVDGGSVDDLEDD